MHHSVDAGEAGEASGLLSASAAEVACALVDEVEAAEAIFCNDGEFSMTEGERAALEEVRGIAEGDAAAPCLGDVGVPTLSFTLRVAGEGAPGAAIPHVLLSVALRPGYPERVPPVATPTVPPDCSASLPRGAAATLHAAVQHGLRDGGWNDATGGTHPAHGEPCVMQVVSRVRDALCELLAEGEGPAEAARGAGGAGAADDATAKPLVLGARLVWFHHIKSTTKRKNIVKWARELDLRGCCKPGYPGLLFVEGEDAACDDIIARLRALAWKAMALRSEERIALPAEAKGIDEARRYLPQFEELGESDMGRMGALMRDAGLEEMFLAQGLKVRRSP